MVNIKVQTGKDQMVRSTWSRAEAKTDWSNPILDTTKSKELKSQHMT